MTFLLDDLRGQILRSTANTKLIPISIYIVLGKAEISEFDVTLGINQNILRF